MKNSGSIVVGSPPLSFYAAQSAVVAAILERAGYKVQRVLEFHETIYPMLGRDEIDIFVASWLPNIHAQLWREVQHLAVPVGRIFTGGRFFWAVPDYMPADFVSSIGDLGKPDVAARTSKTVVSVGPGGQALTNRARHALELYGLDEAGYVIDPRTDSEWVRIAEENCRARRWFATPCWRPCYINKLLALRPIADPRLTMGCADDGFIVANAQFVRRAPERVLEILAGIHVDVESITGMDFAINVEGLSPDEAAIQFLAARNPATANAA